MNVIKKAESRVEFSSIVPGETFKYGGAYFMRADKGLSVRLSDGFTATFEGARIVEKVELECHVV